MYPSCEGRSFVLKPVSESIFEHSVTIRREFPDDSQLRTHVDVNEDDRILIYEYFACDLLCLVQKHLNLSLKARKSILREIGQALEKLHSKQWIHLGLNE
jgi:serine/threonine protein kinase